jgi:hypothetical protein
MNVRVTHVARAQKVATASTECTPVCDDTTQALTVRLTVEGGTVPLKSGTALLDATLHTYDDKLRADVVGTELHHSRGRSRPPCFGGEPRTPKKWVSTRTRVPTVARKDLGVGAGPPPRRTEGT